MKEPDWSTPRDWSAGEERWLELTGADLKRHLDLEEYPPDEQRKLVALASMALVRRLRSACTGALPIPMDSTSRLRAFLTSNGVDVDSIAAEVLRLFKRDFEAWMIWTRKVELGSDSFRRSAASRTKSPRGRLRRREGWL